MGANAPTHATKSDLTANSVSPVHDRAIGWAEFRDQVGKNNDRLRCLQLISAATGYVPLPHQLRFHLAKSRHRLLVSGVGAGKTLASVVQMAMLLIMNRGCSAAFVSPTFDSVQNIVLPEFLRLCDGLARMGTPLLQNYSKSMAKANLVGGGFCLFRSFDRVDNLRGFTLCGIAIDESEVSSRPDYVFQTLNDRVRDPAANVLEINVTTTPKGLRGVPLMFAQARQGSARKDWWAGRATSMDNPHLPKTFLESLKQGHSKRSYEQEVLGHILKPSHVIFPEVNRKRHSMPWSYDPSMPYILACDFGYSHPYYSFIQMLHDGTSVIFDEWVPDECPEQIQKEYLLQKVRKFGKDPEHITGDRAVKHMLGWLMYQFPRSYVHKMRTRQEQQIVAGLEAMRTLFDPMVGAPKLMIADHLWDTGEKRGIVKALEMYRWRLNKENLVTDEPAKDNISDHAIDATRYAVQAVLGDKDRHAAFVLGSTHHADNFAKRNRHRRR